MRDYEALGFVVVVGGRLMKHGVVWHFKMASNVMMSHITRKPYR